MLHLIDELGYLGDQVDDLVLIACPAASAHEIIFRLFSEESRDGLDREADGHDLFVLDDLDIACVELEELVGLALRKVPQGIQDLRQRQRQLIDEVEDVEALLHVVAERVLVQGPLDELHPRLPRLRICCRRVLGNSKNLGQEPLVDILHSPGEDEEVVERGGQFLIDIVVGGTLDQRIQEVGCLHFEGIELLLLCVRREALHLDFSLRLLPLLDQVSATIDDFGLYKAPLVHSARSLHQFDESVEELGTQVAGVDVDVRFLVEGEHARQIGDEVERPLARDSVRQELLS